MPPDPFITVDGGQARRRRSRRRIIAYLVVLAAFLLAAVCWQPGSDKPLPPAARHGVWLSHAWWGDDTWFAGSSRRPEDYRGDVPIARMARRLHDLGLSDWYVHACPATADGGLPVIDLAQAHRLVAANPHGAVLAWVGGVLHDHCHPDDPAWRTRFSAACGALVSDAGLAGVQLNVEPCPSFEPGYLELLDDLRAALPKGARLSIAAYPPPSFLHPHPEVHWNQDFYRVVSRRADDLAIMAYDTAQRWTKAYTWLAATWTREALAWSSVPVRIGVPAYDDAGVGYHDPEIESTANALAGVSAGLDGSPPGRWAGVAVYAEWTLRPDDEAALRRFGVGTTPP